MARILSFFSFLLLSTGPAFAAPKGELKVRFLAQSIPNDLGKIELTTEEASSEAFDLPMNNLSVPQTPPARTFKIWSVKKQVALATIALPAEGESFIALLVVAPEGGYAPIIIPSNSSSFKPGDIYFHNLTPKPVLGFVGTARFELKPGRGTVLTPKGAEAERFYNVGLGVREEEGDRVLITTRWPQAPLARAYVFFYVNPATGRISYRAVDEFVGNPDPAS